MSAKILAAFPAILGGFLFLRFFYFSRFYIARTQGQRLFFYAASLGLILAAISIAWIKLDFWLVEELRPYWRSLEFPAGTSTALAPFVLSVMLLGIGNAVAFTWRKLDGSNEQTTNWADLMLARRGRVGNEIESFLLVAAHDGKPVMVSLEDRKVYVGLLVNVINRSIDSDSWIAIFPDMSGCRNPENNKVNYTTDYAPFTYHNMLQWKHVLEQRIDCSELGEKSRGADRAALKALNEEIKEMRKAHPALAGTFTPEDWVKYIPTDRIMSIGPYDVDADLFPQIDGRD